MTEHLITFLLAAVPLEIARLKQQGGPTDTDWDAIAQWGVLKIEPLKDPDDPVGTFETDPGEAWTFPVRQGALDIAWKGDVILYGEPGQGALLAGLARAIAMLAFQPGGIRVFGRHWQAEDHEPEWRAP